MQSWRTIITSDILHQQYVKVTFAKTLDGKQIRGMFPAGHNKIFLSSLLLSIDQEIKTRRTIELGQFLMWTDTWCVMSRK